MQNPVLQINRKNKINIFICLCLHTKIQFLPFILYKILNIRYSLYSKDTNISKV